MKKGKGGPSQSEDGSMTPDPVTGVAWNGISRRPVVPAGGAGTVGATSVTFVREFVRATSNRTRVLFLPSGAVVVFVVIALTPSEPTNEKETPGFDAPPIWVTVCAFTSIRNRIACARTSSGIP